MTGIACAYHPDRAALAYCAGCGRPLCASCVVRLSEGNYCDACAESPDHRPKAAARRARVWVWAGVAALAVVMYLLSRLL